MACLPDGGQTVSDHLGDQHDQAPAPVQRQILPAQQVVPRLGHGIPPPTRPALEAPHGPAKVSTVPLVQRFPDYMISISFSSGAYFGSHSTVSQWARAARAARLALLVWIGPLSRTSTTGLSITPSLGP